MARKKKVVAWTKEEIEAIELYIKRERARQIYQGYMRLARAVDRMTRRKMVA